jgi:hypothetical protein
MIDAWRFLRYTVQWGWDGMLGWATLMFLTWALYLLAISGRSGCAVLCG